jgi:HK97 family phage portal protein
LSIFGEFEPMRLPVFGRKAATPPVQSRYPIASFGWGSGIRAGGYEAEVRAGFVRNPIAQRAIRTVAEGVAGAPFVVTPGDHPLAAILARPAPTMSGTSFIEGVATWLLLGGNAYLECVNGADGMPAELYALRPERVQIEADAKGWPSAYVYRVEGAATRYPALDGEGRPGLCHIRTFNPLDDHYGLGCLGAAVSAIETHNAASRWATALLENSARPSGALVYEPADGSTLSPEQYERLKAEMETSFTGAANGGRPMLLEGGLRWQALSLTPAELDFTGAKASAAREIALAFGVPPMLLGLPGDNTYANYAEANRALWRLTLLPMADMLADALEGYFRHWWPEVRVRVDRDGIPALTQDRAALWAQVGGASFLSDAEKRAMLGIAGEFAAATAMEGAGA